MRREVSSAAKKIKVPRVTLNWQKKHEKKRRKTLNKRLRKKDELRKGKIRKKSLKKHENLRLIRSY